MYARILLAYDASEGAKRAFLSARELATRFHATLRVIAVVRPPDFGGDVETEAVIENSRRHYEKALQQLANQLSGTGAATQCDVVVGHPAHRIVLEAEQWKADLVVLGHVGQGLMGRWLLGSVAKQVMHHAHCSVLIAR
jgi:nucleotide-binding universal stress UspA family protein